MQPKTKPIFIILAVVAFLCVAVCTAACLPSWDNSHENALSAILDLLLGALK